MAVRKGLLLGQRPTWWTIRLYYLLFTGGTGFLYPFITLFYDRQGLDGTQIGLLGTVGALAALASAPLWGRWSDRIASPRRLLQGMLLVSTVLTLWMSQQQAILWIALIVGANSLLTSAAEPLSMMMALRADEDDQGSGYGSIRLWGSLGWAIAVLGAGWLIEQTTIFTGFVGFAVGMVLSVLMLNLLGPRGATDVQKETLPKTEHPSTRQVFSQLLGSRSMAGLGLALMISWIARAGVYQFEPLYMETLGAGESLIGLAGTLGALIEIPAMLWVDRLLRRHPSQKLLRIGLLLHASAMALVLLIPAVPTILVVRLLVGIAFSFSEISIVVFISDNAPYNQAATALAFFTVTLRNLVALVAAPLGGMVYDAFGAYWLYAMALVGGVLSWLVLTLVTKTMRTPIDDVFRKTNTYSDQEVK